MWFEDLGLVFFRLEGLRGFWFMHEPRLQVHCAVVWISDSVVGGIASTLHKDKLGSGLSFWCLGSGVSEAVLTRYNWKRGRMVPISGNLSHNAV